MATYVYIAVGVGCGVLLAAGGGIVVVVVVFAVTRKTTTCDKRYVFVSEWMLLSTKKHVFLLSIHTCKPL